MFIVSSPVPFDLFKCLPYVAHFIWLRLLQAARFIYELRLEASFFVIAFSGSKTAYKADARKGKYTECDEHTDTQNV